ncbi:hypothetical protein RvY_07927 [Ramazzottius varieornatus]|uniref:Uncharacterized protein n=1 Tax=Ramazzottius varieornatus TaxID=947166 RepID=A0A1D1V449_RAMVA|nr:hypothetical protein RvY_07927 [Ramazzottius varieornatus]
MAARNWFLANAKNSEWLKQDAFAIETSTQSESFNPKTGCKKRLYMVPRNLRSARICFKAQISSSSTDERAVFI